MSTNSPISAETPTVPTHPLREMLAMLRANRASSCVPYFTRAGQLRSVPPAADP